MEDVSSSVLQRRFFRTAATALVAAFALCLSTVAPAATATLLTPPPAQLHEVDVQSCQLECGRVLAACERLRAQGSHCARDFQYCKEDGCASRRKAAAKPARQQICPQRCQDSANLCLKATGKNADVCSAGRAQCEQRCGR